MVHLIADNYATHKTALIRNWFAKRPRFQSHFTPTSASWLNLVERWFGLLTEKQLRRGVHQSSGELEAAIYRYLDVTNEDPKPLVWTKTADQILASVARFCRRTLDTGHLVLQRQFVEKDGLCFLSKSEPATVGGLQHYVARFNFGNHPAR